MIKMIDGTIARFPFERRTRTISNIEITINPSKNFIPYNAESIV